MNFKRKIAAVATAALCSLSAFSVNLADIDKNNVYAAGVTGKTAFQIAEDMTIGWNLGNTLDCANTGSDFTSDPKFAVTRWGNPEPTQQLFDAIKAGGFNTVRIPTTWYEHIQKDTNGDWEISPAWLAYVKKTVDFAYNNDMYVILNVHHEDWVNVDKFTDETKAAAAEKLEDIWTQVAEEFKDYDQRLIFEGMNEPRQTYDPAVEWGAGDTYSWQYINDLNNIFVDVVRGQGSSANKERVLMLPGYVASSNPDTVRQIAIPDGSGNVALSVHAYLPYFFTMDTSDKANHEYKADGSSASGWGANYKQEIDTFFSNMDKIQDEKNAPVIIGEFSASDFGNTDSRINWAKDYLGAAEKASIPCVLWDNNAVYTEGATPSGENHGYINRKNNMWYENSAPVIKAMMETVGVTNYSLPVYSAQDFSWNNMEIGSDWIELFKSEAGQQPLGEDGNPGDWANIEIKGYSDYMNENYKFVMFAKGSTDPTLVLMTSKLGNVDGQGWNYIMPDGTSTKDYVYNFTYEDIKSTVEATGDSMDNANGFFISAHGSVITAYALYAVPVDSDIEPTQPSTTEPIVTTTKVTTTSTTTTTTASQGDTNKVEAEVNKGTDGYTFTLPMTIGNELFVELEASDAVTYANGCVGISVTYNGVDYWVSYNWNISGSDTVTIDITKPGQISYNAGKNVVEDEALISKIAAEAALKNSGMVQIWWANDSSGEGIETSNVEVKSVYVTGAPSVTVTTAYPLVTTTVTTTKVTTTVEPTTPSVNIGTVSLLGDADVDGEIGISDVLALAKFTLNASLYPLANETANANADVTKDNVINSADLQKLVEYNTGTIKKF